MYERKVIVEILKVVEIGKKEIEEWILDLWMFFFERVRVWREVRKVKYGGGVGERVELILGFY